VATLHRFDLQSFHPPKVLAVIGEDRQPIVQPGGSDQKIKVADKRALFPQSAAFPPKDLANLFVDAEDGYVFEKGIERLLALIRLP
jgi:hypothetical protein